MRKYDLMLIFAVVALICGCAAKPGMDEPYVAETRLNIFEADSTPPCVRVVFPGAFVYDGAFQAADGTEKVRGYKFHPVKGVEAYTLLQIYNAPGDDSWALVPLSEQFPDEAKLYEISGHALFPERSAVLVIDAEAGLTLRGVIGEYLSGSTAVFFTIERAVQKPDAAVVKEMKGQLDWFFINIGRMSCK